MKQFIDYYAVLGVSQQATPKQIKTAFIKQSLRWHPDRNCRIDATTTMQGINEANRILSNTTLREKYNFEYQRSQNIPTKQAVSQSPPKTNSKQKNNYSCELKTDDELLFICSNAVKYSLEYIHVVFLELNKRNYSTDAIKELVKRKCQQNYKVSSMEDWFNRIYGIYSSMFCRLQQCLEGLYKIWEKWRC